VVRIGMGNRGEKKGILNLYVDLKKVFLPSLPNISISLTMSSPLNTT